MARMLEKNRFAFLFLAFAFTLIVAGSAEAGQRRAPQSPIPGRLAKVKEGDWILVRTSDTLLKETVTKIDNIRPEEGVKPGGEGWFEPMLMVEYTLERFDGETGRLIDEAMSVVRILDDEQEENAEFVKNMRGRPQRRKVRIDGKNVDVVVIPQVEEGGIQVESWFSDQIGVDGRVAVMVKLPDDNETHPALETVAFGGARQQLQIQRYLKKREVPAPAPEAAPAASGAPAGKK